ncbi:MAG: hypothetical protein LUQ40_07330 [Methanomicrobiales archaeon]|nr:hypothetical protein [Methanomicrobiales archaeon]
MVSMMMVRDDWERIIFPGVFLLLLLIPVTASALDLPDLVVTGVTLSPANPMPGQDVVMSATVQNIGVVAKPEGTYVAVLFYVDDEIINYGESARIIGSGQSRTITGKWDPVTHDPKNWEAIEGSHTVRVVVNPNCRLEESDTTNNDYIRSFSVASPDTSNGGSRSNGRQYNLRGVPGLGDGAFQTIDAICQFTPYLEVQVRYSGHLNDVAVAYERDGTVDQRITYGASGNYGMHLVNPTGKIHLQAQKWSGDQSNGKPIKITVTNCYGKVLYEGQTAEDELDVYLTMKGCDAEEFAAWMAANGPKE